MSASPDNVQSLLQKTTVRWIIAGKHLSTYTSFLLLSFSTFIASYVSMYVGMCDYLVSVLVCVGGTRKRHTEITMDLLFFSRGRQKGQEDIWREKGIVYTDTEES